MSTSEKLTYLNTTKQKLKQAINNLGGDITNETTFREYAQELDNIYDNLPKTTGESSSLSLSTLKGKMNITPKGDTQQDGTPTPDTPINIEVVTGTQEVTISNSDNTETQTQTLSLGDIELCKIGTAQDYLYKSNDKWYKKEYIGKHTLSTSDTWALNRSSNNLYQYRTKNDLLEDVITSPDPYSRAIALCNYYIKGDINGMSTQCFNIGGLKYIGITSNISTLANFNTFITNNSIYVYYVCQTPQDIEITNSSLIEQLDNLEKLKSYNGVTNISSSGNLPMVLSVSALKGES